MENNLVHIKTATGLEIDVDPSAYNDMELLDACYDVQENNNMLALPTVLRHLLTREAIKALYDHVRQPDGRVPVEPMLAELMDIMGIMAAARRDSTAQKPDTAPAAPTAPEPVHLFPGDAPPLDRTKKPPAFFVDTVMAKLHGALHNSPGQADKLEVAARAALEVAKPASAWALLDKIEREIRAANAMHSAQEAAAKHPGPMTEALLHDVADDMAGTDLTPEEAFDRLLQAAMDDPTPTMRPVNHCTPSANAAQASASITEDEWDRMASDIKATTDTAGEATE